MHRYITKKEVEFCFGEDVANPFRKFLSALSHDAQSLDFVPCLAAAEKKGKGFLFGAQNPVAFNLQSAIDEFTFEGRVIYLVLPEEKWRQLAGAKLVASDGVLIAIHDFNVS